MKALRPLLCAAALCLSAAFPLLAEEASVTVRCGRATGEVNPLVFGQNFIAYDPATYEASTEEYLGYTDYGAGMWDPAGKRPVAQVERLAREAGISIARFPGGCGSHKYNWKKAIGPGRTRFLYGLDEFMTSCRDLDISAVYTLSCYIGDQRDAADLVEYLNAPADGSNPNGGIDWAKRRAANGHPRPYDVMYFEVGNEEWHGDHHWVKSTAPEAYARKYLAYYAALKAVDPRVRIGVALHEPWWNEKVLGMIGDKTDFATLHPYPQPRIPQEQIESLPADRLFEITLARAILTDEHYMNRVAALLEQKCGKPVPLAITEYNAGFSQEKPVPYRHCLGAALVNAEFLRIMMKPENSVLMANFWQFSNSYWGMVYSPVDFMDPSPETLEYVKRPTFYVYQLYAGRFGRTLLEAEVACPSYTIADVPPSIELGEGVTELPSSTPVALLTVNASRKDDGTVCLMAVNKSMTDAIPCVITLEDFPAGGVAGALVLNGPQVASTNEDGKRDVGVSPAPVAMEGATARFTFPAHSVVSLEIVPPKEKQDNG